jgi:glycosyltransferase involved in cell wall biosynthesis
MNSVLIFAPNLNGGGAERVLVNYLSNLDYNRLSVTLVLAEKKGVFLELVPDEVQIVNLNKSKTVFCLFKLRRLISKLQPDIVYSTLIRSSIVLSLALICIKHKSKVILRSPNSPKLLKDNRMLNIVQEKLISYAYSKSDLVIAQTLEMKNELVHYHGIEPHKVEVVLNPIAKLAIDKLSVVNFEHIFDIDNINVVASGRLIKQKGFDVLIKSFELIVKENSKYHLHIIGEDVIGELLKLKALVKSLELENNITFHGFQKNPYNFYKNADIYVLSSRWEGLPNTVLENLYLNKPIIATRCIPFMNELIINGVNGWLVDVENVTELSQAILKYKELNLDIKNNSLADFDINSLFQLENYNE